MTTTLLTPQRVVEQLRDLALELDRLVNMLEAADVESVTKRHDADLAESRAFLEAEGSVDARKHTARLAVANLEEDALVAEALVRNIKQRIKAVETRIDVGRSMGTSLRAEMTSIPYSEG